VIAQRRIEFVLGLACWTLLASALAGCATTQLKPASFGPMTCVPRTATAAPPGRLPPMPASPEGKRQETKPLVDFALCPAGQVPVLQAALPTVPKGNPLLGPNTLSAEQFFKPGPDLGEIIRKGLRPWDKVYPHGPGRGGPAGAPPDPAGCNGVLSFGSCYYYGSAGFRRQSADGGGMTATIERPAFDATNGPGHTLDEVAAQGDASDGDIVEVGWNVSTTQYNNANPHLFVDHWMGWVPSCYDGCNWQQYSATYFPGMDIGPLVGRQVYMGWVFYAGNWWAWFDDQWLGYFPGTEWGGNYQHNDLVQWFGEVSSPSFIPPHTDMGNGLFSADARAALNATLCDVNATDWVCWYRDQQTWSATFTAYYDVNRSGFGAVRYGGPGE
jgi:hypothetical protein